MSLKSIQAAFYSTLHGDSTLGGLLAESILDGSAAVFGDVPPNQEYPHIHIDTSRMRPWHTMGGATTGLGWNDTVTVHIWSQYEGDLEALNILDRVVTLLNFASLSVTGYNTVLINLEDAPVLVEMINKVEHRHIPAVFRVRVHQ